MNYKSNILAVAAAATAFLTTGIAASPALAQSAPAIPVTVADLNLDSAAGRGTLDRRIASAARKLCGDYSVVELKWAMESRACQQDVIASANEQSEAFFLGGSRYASLVVSRTAS